MKRPQPHPRQQHTAPARDKLLPPEAILLRLLRSPSRGAGAALAATTSCPGPCEQTVSRDVA